MAEVHYAGRGWRRPLGSEGAFRSVFGVMVATSGIIDVFRPLRQEGVEEQHYWTSRTHRAIPLMRCGERQSWSYQETAQAK